MTGLESTHSQGGLQAALLIDADNFADPVAIDAAWAQLKSRAGRVSVCRAYGSSARLQSMAAVWRTLGARTFPNLVIDKNTTDAALITDAVALHFQQGIRLLAIASGDADFAPLAVRLREWGCEVWCFSMEGVLFAGARAYYDHVVTFAPQPPSTATPPPTAYVSPVPKIRSEPAPQAQAPVAVPKVQHPTPIVLAKPTTPKIVASASATKSAKPTPAPIPQEVQRVLLVAPALKNASLPLNNLVPKLRQNAIFAGTTKSTKFFAKYPAYFQLTPAKQPTHVQYISPTSPPPPPPPAVARAKQQTITPAPAILSWPVVMPRRPAPPLLSELHDLRSVLSQLALRRITVADVLLAVPELIHGQGCSFSAVAGRLRQRGLLRSCDSVLRILERFPDSFAAAPETNPQAVIYLR